MKLPACLSLLPFKSFFLFIIGAFLYFYYVHNRILLTQQVNESVLIEKALEHIPTCTPDDQTRQRSLLTTLYAWTHLAQKHNIEYWIAFGTLVGYVQRRGLLPHDRDVDILIMSEETLRLVALASSKPPAFDTDIYVLKIQPHWSIIEWSNRSYFRSDGINFVAPNARFINKNLNTYIDIYPAYDYHPERSKNSSIASMLTFSDISYNWLHLPKNLTFPLRPCQFSTLNVWCPAESKKIVATQYDQSSIFLSDTVCINGRWENSIDYKFAKAALIKS